MTERRILKWTIPVDDRDHPIGVGPVVHVASQRDDSAYVQVWTDETVPGIGVVDLTSARVYGTGQPLPVGDEVCGTAVVMGGQLVWHVLRRAVTAPPALPRRLCEPPPLTPDPELIDNVEGNDRIRRRDRAAARAYVDTSARGLLDLCTGETNCASPVHVTDCPEA